MSLKFCAFQVDKDGICSYNKYIKYDFKEQHYEKNRYLENS